MRRALAFITLVLGLTLLAAPPASAAVAASIENRTSGSPSGSNNLVGIEPRLCEEAVWEKVALAYELASDDAVAARAGARYSDDLVKAAQKQFPGKAGKIENHHVEPKYLGGAANGRTVPIDAAYHQQITNEFRRLWPYGQGTPSAQQLERIMQQVYEKYPLPGM